MRHLIVLVFLSAGIVLGCATTCGKDNGGTTGPSDAPGDDPVPGCPAGLNCDEHGGCNSDYPYCCDGQCKANPCSNSEEA